jgi:hypothetical protein
VFDVRPCIESGCPERTERTRCAKHTRTHDATRRPPTAQRGYDAAWQRHSREQRKARPTCEHPSGCHRPSHSLDHTTGLVLCVSHHPTERNGGVKGR